MYSIYDKTFIFIEGFKPNHIGIYFSLILHFLILLFALGLPDFFKPKKIFIPNVIPIEILNVSDITSLTPKNKDIQIDSKQTKQVKQKKFNSSDNTEIQKIDLQEKPKVKNNLKSNQVELIEKEIIKSQNNSSNNSITQKSEPKKISLKEKQVNNIKDNKTLKLDNIDTLDKNKIKPKLKPKPVKKTEAKSDVQIENNVKPITQDETEIAKIDKPKLIQKPEPDFNLATMLKDLRNEDVSKNQNNNDSNEKNLDENEDDQTEANLEISISEMDLVLQQLRSCFNPRAGTQIVGDEMVKISAKIDREAYVRKDTVQIVDTNISKSNPYYEAITESALATLYNPLCSKLKLPINKYDSWKDLKITIDYSWIKN